MISIMIDKIVYQIVLSETNQSNKSVTLNFIHKKRLKMSNTHLKKMLL